MDTKLYVGNLSFSTTDKSLGEFFAPYGMVVDFIVARDRATGASRGFGFVSFNSDDESSQALQATNGQTLDGSVIQVSYAIGRGES